MKEPRSLTPPVSISDVPETTFEKDIDATFVEDVAIPQFKGGTAEVRLGLTIQIAQYEPMRYEISLDETYTGIGEDTRENKFEDLHQDVFRRVATNAPDLAKACKKLLKQIRKELETSD